MFIELIERIVCVISRSTRVFLIHRRVAHKLSTSRRKKAPQNLHSFLNLFYYVTKPRQLRFRTIEIIQFLSRQVLNVSYTFPRTYQTSRQFHVIIHRRIYSVSFDAAGAVVANGMETIPLKQTKYESAATKIFINRKL